MKLLHLTAVLLVAPKLASAQAFNVDVAYPYPLDVQPGSTYGAAAGQPGYWNVGNVASSLRALDGSLTSAAFGIAGGGAAHFAVPSLTGDEKLMMESGSQTGASDNPGFANLTPGAYDLYVYMWGGPILGTKTVTCSVFNGTSYANGSVSYTNQWPGSQIQGVTYAKIRVDVLPSYQYLSMNFSWYDGQPAGFTIVNGLQLVPVPAPGASALLLGAGTLALRRRRPDHA